MTNENKIVNNYIENAGCATFVYNNKKCGVDAGLDSDGHPKCYVWYGENDYYFDDIYEAAESLIFDGKSLKEIEPFIDIDFC